MQQYEETTQEIGYVVCVCVCKCVYINTHVYGYIYLHHIIKALFLRITKTIVRLEIIILIIISSIDHWGHS